MNTKKGWPMWWETTTDDVAIVLNAHGIKVTDERLSEIHDGLDFDDIESGICVYDDMDEQTASMFCDIEDQLMGDVIQQSEKKFPQPA